MLEESFQHHVTMDVCVYCLILTENKLLIINAYYLQYFYSHFLYNLQKCYNLCTVVEHNHSTLSKLPPKISNPLGEVRELFVVDKILPHYLVRFPFILITCTLFSRPGIEL